MARFNAASELATFWIDVRHGFLVTESVPVAVPYGLSDIDILAMHPDGSTFTLPNGQTVGPRVIIEAKDEHDFDPKGKAFGKALRSDMAAMGDARYVLSKLTTPIKFSMLREAHYRVACDRFGVDDFDRLFIVHAVDPIAVADLQALMAERRIWWVTLPEIVRDLEEWYRKHPRPTGLRHSPVGDLLHLLFGYCGVTASSG